jgi:hypothetical protein
MSGLYNVVHGRNPNAAVLHQMLQQVQPFDAGRLRDAWVEKQSDVVVIRLHTRNGGGNRGDYQDAITSMIEHPWFAYDEDLEYDNTYADFYFVVPVDNEIIPLPILMTIAVDPVDMSAKWQEAIADLERGKTSPAIEKMKEQLQQAFESGSGGGVIYVGDE